MSMISWLQSKLYKGSNNNPKTPITATEDETLNYSNTITFGIDTTNTPWISIELNNTAPSAAEYFAKLLVQIYSGTHHKEIIELLIELSRKNPHLSDMVENILISWGSQLPAEDKKPSEKIDQKPLIRPRYVFTDGQAK